MKRSVSLAVLLLAAPAALAQTVRTIAEVQGNTHFSPYNGTLVSLKSVVITAFYSSKYVVQSLVADSDLATSEAIQLFGAKNQSIPVGTVVDVNGTVLEYIPTSSSSTGLPLTQIINSVITVKNETYSITPVVLGSDRVAPPRYLYNDTLYSTNKSPNLRVDISKTNTTLDMANRGLDYWESLESMRVTIERPVVLQRGFLTSSSKNVGIYITFGNATNANKAGGLTLLNAPGEEMDFQPERLVIRLMNTSENFNGFEIRMGDVLAPLTGILDFASQAPCLYVSKKSDVKVISVANNTVPIQSTRPNATTLRIASYNVENFNQYNPAEKIRRIGETIVNYLGSPDIINLLEIQDNDGQNNTGVVSCNETVKVIIDSVLAYNGPSYQGVWIDPIKGTTGGAPGGNIRNVFLYNPERISLLSQANDTPSGPTDNQEIYYDETNGITLKYNPGFIDPNNSTFANSRRQLIVGFNFSGVKIFGVSVHSSSKSGSESTWGTYQPPYNNYMTNRIAQMQVLKDFADRMASLDSNVLFFALGDFNDFIGTDPLELLVQKTANGSELYNLEYKIEDPLERYGYQYEGMSESLDHFIVSKPLNSIASFEHVRVNSYSTAENDTSDHDPILADFDMTNLLAALSPSASPSSSPVASTTPSVSPSVLASTTPSASTSVLPEASSTPSSSPSPQIDSSTSPVNSATESSRINIATFMLSLLSVSLLI